MMKSTLIFLSACTGLWAGSVWSTTCVVLGEVGSQVQINGGSSISLTRDNTPHRATSCRSVTSTRGTVDLCQTGGPCSRIKSGGNYTVTSGGGESGVWERMLSMLQGKLQDRAGGRLLDESGEASGFPAGDLLMPHKTLSIPLDSSVFPSGITHFALIDEDTEKTVFTSGARRGSIDIPGKRLRRDKGYLWQLKAGAKRYEGSFLVLSKEAAAEVEADVVQLLGNIAKNSAAALFIRAGAYEEYALHFDRDRMLSEYQRKTR